MLRCDVVLFGLLILIKLNGGHECDWRFVIREEPDAEYLGDVGVYK